MARAERWVEVVWEGNLIQDHGKIVNVGSGALGDLPLSWAACTERSDGKASPEELLAAAHAACYVIAFPHAVALSDTPATSLTVRATCAFEQVGFGFKVTTTDLEVRGTVPGLDQATFEKVAQQAEQAAQSPMPCATTTRLTLKLPWKASHLEGGASICRT